MGKIRMKAKEVAFRRDMKDIVCIGFLNTGDTPVVPAINSELLPDYIRAWCDTSGVEQGKEGEICISFDPEKFAGSVSAGTNGPVRVPLVMTGLGVPPGTSTVMLTID